MFGLLLSKYSCAAWTLSNSTAPRPVRFLAAPAVPCILLIFCFLSFFFGTKKKPAENISSAFLRFYDEIRAVPLFKDVTILYAFENNLGNEHNWLWGLIQRTRRVHNVFVLYENKLKIGFNTGELSKLRGYDIIKSYCSTSGIQFYKDLLTINADYGSGGRSIMKARFIKEMMQLKQFGRKTANGRRSRVVTGIHASDGKRLPQTDDVVMAFLLAMDAATRFYRKELDLPYREIYGLRFRTYDREEELMYVDRIVARGAREMKERRDELHATGIFVGGGQ